ncbi:MAG: transposase [Blastocatellia bacterium]|nr:transposase [Blastocatellia bacterium]
MAESISDVSLGMLFEMLDYKAEEGGKSGIGHCCIQEQNCSQCSEKIPKPPSVRWHKCPYCGLEMSRDENRNILARGIDLLQTYSAPGGLALPGQRRTFSTESSFPYQACCLSVFLSSPRFSKRGRM